MIDFQEILEICRADALANKLDPSELSVWESICRSYSKKFHTPLHMVLKMDPEYVVRQHYAEQLDDVDIDENLEELLESIRSIEDPDYEAKDEEALQEFNRKAEEEEEERIAKGMSVREFYKKKSKKMPDKPEKKDPPKSGGFNPEAIDEENER